MRIALSYELLGTAALGLVLIGFGTPRLVAKIAAPPTTGDLVGSAARHHLEARLAAAPADPAGWAALAQLDLAESGPSAPASRALALSLLTGPNEPGLLWKRVELGLALWPALAESDRTLMEAQFRQAWEADPAKLAGLAARSSADPVRAALADQPDAAARFKAMLEITSCNAVKYAAKLASRRPCMKDWNGCRSPFAEACSSVSR